MRAEAPPEIQDYEDWIALVQREATGPNGQRTTVTDNVVALIRLAR